MAEREGHGWGARLLPLFSFLLVVEFANRASDAVAAWLLPVKVALPFGLFLYYLRRGSYEELRGFSGSAGGVALDVAVGVAGAALWVAPYLLFPGLRPDPADAFDPGQLGASLVGVALALRAFGYVVVTPLVEELFHRSWLHRYADVFDREGDFRDVPVGRPSWRGFLFVAFFFTFSHASWEWPVALAWISLTTLWYYRRKHLLAVVIVHAASNLAIFLLAVLGSGRWRDPDGTPVELWFFL